MIAEINVRRIANSKIKDVDFDNLEFGKYVADHMLVADYKDESWNQPAIVPFANLSLSPTTLALHYGQTVFEGMKVFRTNAGRINIFRLDKHYHRFCNSFRLARYCRILYRSGYWPLWPVRCYHCPTQISLVQG